MGQLYLPCNICALFLPDFLDVSEQHCGAEFATMVIAQKKALVTKGARALF